MQITSVRVKKIEKENSRMKATASVVLDDCFKVRDIRIIEGEEGLFIAMPSRKLEEGKYRDVAHPTNPETRDVFSKAILDEYNKLD
ncbi:MAG: septation regulator SpoVG [Bacilli bacterium]